MPSFAQDDPTPSPLRIPETIPPNPTPPPQPPPPTTEAPVPTQVPPTEVPPTTEPTAEPSPPPTEAPVSPPPTASPTEATPSPTMTPTESPSASPTASPTDSPTVTPTIAPSVPPTPSPTVLPSSEPSSLPTSQPSTSPSTAPSFVTLMPTTSPEPSTQPPSDVPSHRPSKHPSSVPSLSPSDRPSAVPSSSPTLSLQEDLVEVFMTFNNANVLQSTSIRTFDRITRRFIQVELETSPEPPMDDLIVWTYVQDQRTINLAAANDDSDSDNDNDDNQGRRRRTLRVLQQGNDESPLLIYFDTTVEFRSNRTDYDVPGLVGGTWDTPEEQETYIAALKATGDPAFQDITAMRTEINGWTPGGGGGRMEDEEFMLYVIIGASVGGGLLVFVVGVAMLYCRRRRRTKTLQTSAPTFATTQPVTKNGERISTEIIVDHQDDISTLGDPMYGAGGMLIPGLEKDETIAAGSFVSGDYEYTKTYGAAEAAPLSVSTGSVGKRPGLMDESDRGSSALDLGQGEDPFFMDDSSFEEQYQDGEVLINVMAPPGKLGMVIDTPSGGVPIVHAIKESSVLVDQVKVGDRLLSVDGEDCSMMSAMQVSKLISQRAENPTRAFVFSRSRGRVMSKDD